MESPTRERKAHEPQPFPPPSSVDRRSLYHNPGQPGDGAKIREKSPYLNAAPGVHAFILGALTRLVGAADYTLHREPHEAIDEQEGDLVVNLYDLAGSYVLVKIEGRGISGDVSAVCGDLLAMKGPTGRAFKAIRKAFGVDRFQITFSVVEEAYGLGRIEWSVNR